MTKYGLYSAVVLFGFTVAQWRGVALWPRARHVTPPTSIRSSPVGNRSYYYGSGSRGFSGGK